MNPVKFLGPEEIPAYSIKVSFCFTALTWKNPRASLLKFVRGVAGMGPNIPPPSLVNDTDKSL
jgi:hypothetical protein